MYLRERLTPGSPQEPQPTENPLITATLNPLPRSVHRAGHFNLLDGPWGFDLDRDGRGLNEAWFMTHTYDRTIDLPCAIEAHLPGGSDEYLDPLVAWYERDLSLPDGWEDNVRAGTVELQLSFGACGYETRVWLNGHALRTTEGEDVHLGEYTLFNCEVPAAFLNADGAPNRLTIRTADSLDPDIPRGKQQSQVYRRGGIWYQTISGPVGSIWMELVPRNRLRSRLDVRSNPETGLVEFTLTTRVRDEGSYSLHLEIIDRPGDRPVVRKEVPVTLRPGEARHRLALTIPDAQPWSPDSPYLYRVNATLSGQGGGNSTIHANFGLRNVETRGRWIYLNGKRTYLHGILYQPNLATFKEMTAHLWAIKRLGCNMVRIHIAGVDPRIYDLADQIGLMVWVEVPSPHRSSELSRANHRAELLRLLPLVSSHPSVCILSLYNEDWGIEDVAESEATRQYIASQYAYLQAHYPHLLVVDNDGWRHVSVDGKLQSDLLTAHIYTPSIERWGQKLDKLEAGDTTCLYSGDWCPSLVVGDSFFYGEQLPVLVSEWGGFGWSGYDGPGETADKVEKIRSYKREMLRRGIAGDVYTQATSIEEEVNGIIDPATGELLVPEGILGDPTE